MEKFFLSVATMVICLNSSSVVTPLTVILLMAGLIIIGAGIPARVLARLIFLPVSFLIVGALTITFSIAPNPEGLLFNMRIWNYTLGIRGEDLHQAIEVFSKSLGSVTCLYFLSLTTPMVEIMSVLRRLKVPELFIEIMGLVYRFIFVFMETALIIQTSQSSRLGYKSLKASFKSMSQLLSSLFVRAFYRSKELSTALSSRCYNGELKVLEKKYTVSRKNWIFILILQITLIILNLILNS